MYETLLETSSSSNKLVHITKSPKKDEARGCEPCPMNGRKRIQKVFGKVRGRELFIVGMAPGPEENEEGKEFVGRSGKFLWDELKKVGIERDQVDVQNVLRCYPSDDINGRLVMRNPSTIELKCCSIYTEKALAKSKAKVYVVLGNVAQKQFLGKEYKATRKIFYSEALQAKVYCLYHPSYFIRGQFPPVHLTDFRKNLEAVANDLSSETSHTRSSYLEQQNYKAIVTKKDAIEAERLIRLSAKKGQRISVDTEYDTLDGVTKTLCVGFSRKPGEAFVFIYDHPLARKVDGEWRGLKSSTKRLIGNTIKNILSDASIEKILHHGSSDNQDALRDFGTTIEGYNFDTEYAEFLKFNRKQSGLAAVAAARFPEFGEYKNIIYPYALPKGVDLEAEKIGPTEYDKMHNLAKRVGVHYSQIPLKQLVLRNGADADITKRIELSTAKDISLPLLRIYKDAAFVLARMEPNGPAFDYAHNRKLKKFYPPRLESVIDKLRAIAGGKFEGKISKKVRGSNRYEDVTKVFWDNSAEETEFKPGSHEQVKALLFQKLKLKAPATAFAGASGFRKGTKPTRRDKDGRYFAVDSNGVERQMNPSSGKTVMEVMARESEVCQLMTEYRRLAKIESTYLDSYENCAKNNDGKLRTRWNLTGTSTGRLSSGGAREDDEGNFSVINLQNIHGDANLKNQVVADPEWRKLYGAIEKAVRRCKGSKYLAQISDVQERIARIVPGPKKAKEKRKELEGEHYAIISRLQMLLGNSSKFKKLCSRIVANYGDVKLLLGFDQGQVEVRVMAQASGDKALIRDCMESDIHTEVGHRMTGWKKEDIKKDKKVRTLTKNIHFGILFGLSANGLMAFILAKDPDSTITAEEAERLYENYFKAYPGVRRFIERMREFVQEHGYVETMFGFRRPLGNGAGVSFDTGNDSEDNEFESDGAGGAFWGNQAINCLDFKTEALTQRGWVKGFELKRGDVLLTKNATNGKLEWQSATDVKVYPEYDKDLVLWKSRSFNAASTFDHRWLVGPEKKPYCRLTGAVTQSMPVHRTGDYIGPSVSPYSDDLVRLVGWFLTDGHIGRGSGYGSQVCSVVQSVVGNPAKVRQIDKLFGRLHLELEDFAFRTSMQTNQQLRQWHFSGRWGAWMRSMFPQRVLTPEFLSQLTKSQLELLLHTMVLGDGTGSKLSRLASKSKGESGRTNCKISFCSRSKKQAGMFQMLCMLTGRACNIKKRDMRKYAGTGGRPQGMTFIWIATVLRRTRAHIYPQHKKIVKNKGVWCPMVPNTYFVARRLGQVFVTGNTPVQSAAHTLMLMAMAIMERKPKKYRKLLEAITLEIHDYIGFKIALKDVLSTFALAKPLLEKEPLKLIAREYPDIEWKIPLQVEGVVGLRYGDSVEADGKTLPEMLLGMFLETYAKETRLDHELALVS